MVQPLLPLPIDEVLDHIADKLSKQSSVVIHAPPGAGKTTRVPPALLASGLAKGKQILMLEPRRIAARMAAKRIAFELGCHVGGKVGYLIRFERMVSSETRILVVTEGVLIRLLQEDPFLENVGVVIFDEFHERSINTDLSLAMTRRVQREVRDDLKIVVMSATLQTGPIERYLEPCGVVTSLGRTYPVTTEYLDRKDDRPLYLKAAFGVRRMLKRTKGDILVFLPGAGDIHRTARQLEPLAAQNNLLVMPLFGSLSVEKQEAVLKPHSRQKIILATNVAETSVTVDGVTAVVDTGFVKILNFDTGCGLNRLEITRISKNSADQRRGRAGRQQAGICFRLWLKWEQNVLPDSVVPEIQRIDLAGPILQLLAWGEQDPASFDWFESPGEPLLARGLERLKKLGATDEQGITKLGRQMARLPLPPRLSRVLIEGARLGHRKLAALAVVLLAEKDPFPMGFFQGAGAIGSIDDSELESDLMVRINAIEELSKKSRAFFGDCSAVNFRRIKGVIKSRNQLMKFYLEPPKAIKKSRDEALMCALLAAFPDRVAARRQKGSNRGVTVVGRGVELTSDSCVRESELFLCLEIDAGRRGQQAHSVVRKASALKREWLSEGTVTVKVSPEFDDKRESVVFFEVCKIGHIILSKVACERIIDDKCAQILAAGALKNIDRAFRFQDDIKRWICRVRWLRERVPGLKLPAFDDLWFTSVLPDLCKGKYSFAELGRLPIAKLLSGYLTYEQQKQLHKLAPSKFQVPSGSQIKLQYEEGKVPVLSVRIQEMFGLEETPSVLGGQQKLLLHLLAPNGRPQQITDDLSSFWKNAYSLIRKELRQRYPKHAWPLDPLNAPPERRPQRRRRKK